MRRLLIFMGIFALTFSLNAQNIPLFSGSNGVSKGNDQFSGFQATFSFNQIESVTIEGTERGTFSAITIEGTYMDGKAGTPGLPVFKKMIAVPVGATPNVMVKNHSTNEYNLTEYGFHTIFPVQPDVRKDQDLSKIPFAFNDEVYYSNDYNNAPIAEVEIIGTLRGVIVGMLTVRPVQYNPAANIIKVFNDVEIEVTFKNGNQKQTQDLFVNTFSPYFAKQYRELFNNGVHKDTYSEHPDLYNTPVRMLVIANRMFEATLQPWIEWKTLKGFYMDVNYTDVIGTSAAAIKTFCHNKYNQGLSNGTVPTFIVIVGDTPQVPASQTGAQSAKATDLYYAKVNTGSTWFPDMYYSRLSAQTTQQLANQIEKILYYEKYQFADPTFLDNVLLIAGADGTWNPRVGQPQINYATTYYYNAAHGYSTIHKYLTSPYNGAVADFNNVGFANYTAHCGEDVWAWNGSGGYSSSQISSQTNINKYYVAMGNCCLAADFGYGECFGETMMRAEKKGSVGYIGSSPSSYWGGDFHFTVGAYSGSINTVTNPTLANTTTGCYDFMFQDADFNTLCSHIYGGNIAVTYAYGMGYETHVPPNYYWEAYNVLGDGSLMPYNGQAADYEVSHMAILPIGHPTYNVTATPGSYVAISKDGVLYGVGVVDQSGEIDVVLDPPITSGGDVDIVVTRNQYKPYIQQIPAAALEGPYIVYQSYLLSDPDDNTSLTVDYETTVDVNIELKNVGTETATNCSLELVTNNEYVTINNSTFTVGDIESEEIVNFAKIFNFTVSKNVPDQTKIDFFLIVSSPDVEEPWTSRFSVIANAPILKAQEFEITEIEGNGNGKIDAGETIKVSIPVSNIGHAISYPMNLTLRANLLDVEVLTSTINHSGIEGGETDTFDFIFTTGEDIPVGTELTLKFIAKSDIFSFVTEKKYTIGLLMEDFETGNFSSFNWQHSGNLPWTITNSGTNSGTYCAKSGAITHNQSTTLSVTMNVEAEGEISFWRKVSSEARYDLLKFYINGSQQDEWSGDLDWAEFSYPVLAGNNTFTWTYSKDGSVSTGSDCAWIDDIIFPSPIPMNPVVETIIEDFETGNFTANDWQFSGNLDWSIVNTGANNGTYCAKSGAITHSQTTSMSLTLNLENGGKIAFWRKVSSEAGYDYLEFYINDEMKDKWAGTHDWTQFRYPVQPGQNTFKWTYSKDGSVSSGSDCAWVDDISVFDPPTPLNSPPYFTVIEVEPAIVGVPYFATLIAEDPDEEDEITFIATHIPAWMTLTDNGDGTATLTGMPELSYDDIFEQISISITDGLYLITEDIDFVVDFIGETSEITFEVKGIDGLPIQGVAIGILPINTILYTNNQGTISAYLPDGDYQFNASKVGYHLFEGEFSIDGEQQTIPVTMNRIMYEITFEVTIENIPVTGVNGSVTIISEVGSDSKTFSATEQDFEIVFDLPDGNYTYIVEIGNYDTVEDTFTVNGEPQSIPVAMYLSMYEVTFEVNDIDNMPVEDAEITIVQINTVLNTDENGIGTILLPNGDYDFTVIKEGFGFYTSAFIVNGEPETVPVTLLTGYKITFDVKDKDNLPIEGAILTINQIFVDLILLTNEDGIITINLPDGDYEYIVSKEGYDNVEGILKVEGEPQSIEVKMVLSGIKDVDFSNITLYPNPTTGELRITNNELRITNIEIFDVIGRVQSLEFKVQSSETRNTETLINISQLSAGIYFIQITTDKGITTKKVVKN